MPPRRKDQEEGEVDPQLDAFSVDVRALLDRSVANLYSHLVTRPTGRAVRLAIESQLEEIGTPALSLVDLSSVAILDYSCADEVVAKLLLARGEHGGGTYFVLRGVGAHHREPIEAVLERHELAVVGETASGRFELLGWRTETERKLWTRVEERRRIPARELAELVDGLASEVVEPEPAEGSESTPARSAPDPLEGLIARRLLFRDPLHGDLHALSTLIRGPETRGSPRGRNRSGHDGVSSG